MQSSHIIIVSLLIANLSATIWFGVNKPVEVNRSSYQGELNSSLPSILNENVRNSLYTNIKENFNNRDYDALYDVFGAASKAQMDKGEAIQVFEKLASYFVKIIDGAYSNSEFISQRGDTKYYKLNYAIKLSEESKFGQSGTLTVTVAIRNDGYEVYAFKINAG